MVLDKAKAEINPLVRTTGKNAPLGRLCAGGGFARHKTVGADSISARARLRQDKPPRAHIECAPTDFAFDKGRKFHAERCLCGGPPATKNVGADSISARARLRQDKLPRAHIECAPTDFAFDKGRKLHAGLRRHKKRRGGFHIRPCALAAGQTSAGAYRMRPYGFRFQHRLCRFWAIQQKKSL